MQGQKNDARIRQVAIVLTLVDPKTARQLLGQFPTDQAKQIRQAMANLGAVSQQEQGRAIELFRSMTGGRSPAEQALAQAQSSDQLEISEAARQRAFQQPQSLVGSLEGAPIDAGAPIGATHPTSAPPTSDGTPKGASHLSSQLTTEGASHRNGQPRNGTPDGVWSRLGPVELAEILRRERPIVKAVVINQVSLELATALVERLDSESASEALALLPNLQHTDPEILSEICQHLHRSIAEYERPRQAAAQGLRRIQAILGGTSADHRDRLQRALSSREPGLSTRLGLAPPQVAPGAPAASARTSPTTASPGPAALAPVPSAPIPSAPIPSAPIPSAPIPSAPVPSAPVPKAEVPAIPPEPKILPFPGSDATRSSEQDKPSVQMPFEDLVLLSPEDLSVVLRACEPAVILLALSGASESFYKRFKSMLHPRDARRLDARLANQGPMQMRDIDRAQLQMSQAAGQLLASGRIGSLMNMTFTAAA